MAGIKRVELVQIICRQAHIKRRNPEHPNLSKQELLKLHAYLTLTSDLVTDARAPRLAPVTADGGEA